MLKIASAIALAAAACSFDGVSPGGTDGGTDGASEVDASTSNDAGTADAGPYPQATCAGPGVVNSSFTDAQPEPLFVPVGNIQRNGTLRITTAGASVPEFAGYVGKRWLDLLGADASIEIVSADPSGADATFIFDVMPGRGFGFVVQQGNLVAFVDNPPRVETSVPFDSTAHRYLRISERNGELIFLVGPDASNVSEFFRAPAPSYVRYVRPVIATFVPDNFANPVAATTEFDNLNIGVPPQDWCGYDQLGNIDVPTADEDWAPNENPLNSRCDAQLDVLQGEVTVSVEASSAGTTACTARIEARQLYVFDGDSAIEVELRDPGGVGPARPEFHLAGIVSGFLTRPLYRIRYVGGSVCAQYTTDSVNMEQCVGATPDDMVFKIENVGGDVVFSVNVDDNGETEIMTVTGGAVSVPVSPQFVIDADVVTGEASYTFRDLVMTP